MKVELIVITRSGNVHTFDPMSSTRAEREAVGEIAIEAIAIFEPSPVVIRIRPPDGRDHFFRTVERQLNTDGNERVRTWLCLGTSRVMITDAAVPLIEVSVSS
jgi:hypothetical protein